MVFSTVAWSTAGYFTRLIVLDSWTILFWRGVFGGATAFAYLGLRHRGGLAREVRRIGRPGLWFSVVSALGMTTFLTALKLTTVAHFAIIYATIPFVAAVMAWVFLRERSSASTLIASAAACLGVVVMVGAGAGEGGALGDVLSVITTLLMGVMIVMARRRRGIPMIPAAGLSALLAAAFALPFAHVWPINTPNLLELALFGATNMGLGLILFMQGSQLVPAAESALIGSLEAPLAPFWVWLAFGETPVAATIVGGAIVMAAVLAHVSFGARRPLPSPAPVA